MERPPRHPRVVGTEKPATRRNTTLADDSLAPLDTLCKAIAAGEVDVLRDGVRTRAQGIIWIRWLED
jgi:hypothetical protein